MTSRIWRCDMTGLPGVVAGADRRALGTWTGAVAVDMGVLQGRFVMECGPLPCRRCNFTSSEPLHAPQTCCRCTNVSAPSGFGAARVARGRGRGVGGGGLAAEGALARDQLAADDDGAVHV